MYEYEFNRLIALVEMSTTLEQVIHGAYALSKEDRLQQFGTRGFALACTHLEVLRDEIAAIRARTIFKL